MDNEVSRKNPYDFESDDDDSIKDLRLQIDEQSISDNEQNYRVPPLRIVIARSVLQNDDRYKLIININ